LRAFVAIFPPPEVGEHLLRSARSLVRHDRVRWSPPQNVHLTLKFLGNVAEEDADRLREALGTLAGGHEPFLIEPSGLGAFPSKSRARIVWAGVAGGAGRLRALAGELEGTLETIGFERESRAYVPHITLGRVRGRPVGLEASGPLSGPGFVANRIELVESVPGGGGSVYSTVADFPLSEDGD
jgi:2'-5' RNA ligase